MNMPMQPGQPGMAPAPAPAAPQAPQMPGGMGPTGPMPGAQAKQQIEENANIAIQGGMAAAEAAKAAPDVPEEAAAKIEEGVMLINEGKQDALAPAVPNGGGDKPGNPVEGTGDQSGGGTKEGGE